MPKDVEWIHAKIVDEPRNLASHQEDRHYLRESEHYRRPSWFRLTLLRGRWGDGWGVLYDDFVCVVSGLAFFRSRWRSGRRHLVSLIDGIGFGHSEVINITTSLRFQDVRFGKWMGRIRNYKSSIEQELNNLPFVDHTAFCSRCLTTFNVLAIQHTVMNNYATSETEDVT